MPLSKGCFAEGRLGTGQYTHFDNFLLFSNLLDPFKSFMAENRNQSIDLLWFLYDRELRHKRMKLFSNSFRNSHAKPIILESKSSFTCSKSNLHRNTVICQNITKITVNAGTRMNHKILVGSCLTSFQTVELSKFQFKFQERLYGSAIYLQDAFPLKECKIEKYIVNKTTNSYLFAGLYLSCMSLKTFV